MDKKNFFEKNNIISIVITVLIIAGIGYGGYAYYTLSLSMNETQQDLQETKQELSDIKNQSETRIEALGKEVDVLEHDNLLLSEALQNERQKNEQYFNTIEDLREKVSEYEKLNKIDPEILKKYSKVYFLSEHYVPSSLTLIEKRYLYFEDDPEQIHAEVKPFLTDMLDEAERDGVDLFVRSGYRSFGTQLSLKSQYEVIYGEGTANEFSAEQGYSEHQLGTTVDFLTTGINGTLDGFGNTEAFQWLQENAHNYGFILSYPENNGYYIYEPWHWRFVGKDLARYLNRNDMHFYDMNQRDIDDYLINVFDE